MKKCLLHAIFLQFFIALLSYLIPEFRELVFVGIAGLDPSHVFLRQRLEGIRFFGWSAELSYTTPVTLLVGLTMLLKDKLFQFRNLILYLAFFSISILNARIAIFSTLLVLTRLNFKTFFLIVVLLSFVLIVAINYNSHPIVDYLLSDFQYGGSRTLRILLSNFHIPDLYGILFGNGEYLYGNAVRYSDIGYIILLNFGGAFYLLIWIGVITSISWRAGLNNKQKFSLCLLSAALAFKGLVFSGNGYTFLLLTFAALNQITNANTRKTVFENG